MNGWQADHARSVEEAGRAVNAVAAELADRVAAAVAGEGKGPIPPDARARIMRRVDAALDQAYGIERGAVSPMEVAIATAANRARLRAIRRGFGPVARAIRRDAALAKAIEHANQG